MELKDWNSIVDHGVQWLGQVDWVSQQKVSFCRAGTKMVSVAQTVQGVAQEVFAAASKKASDWQKEGSWLELTGRVYRVLTGVFRALDDLHVGKWISLGCYQDAVGFGVGAADLCEGMEKLSALEDDWNQDVLVFTARTGIAALSVILGSLTAAGAIASRPLLSDRAFLSLSTALLCCQLVDVNMA